MNELKVKAVMDQIHISPEMQKDIIVNVKRRMADGNRKTGIWNLKKIATAAAFLLMAGVISFPVRAFVSGVLAERMESVPRKELKDLNDMVQSQPVSADGFSREYSDSEKERSKTLWEAYENGTFPEQIIAQVDNEEEAPEGALCYIRSTGYFHLPTQEMTDEEILQIIDFQHKMSYAVAQSAETQTEQMRLDKNLQDVDGISEDEAIEIAEKQLKVDLGEAADRLELITYGDGSHTSLTDDTVFAKAYGFESKSGMIYNVGFENPDTSVIYAYLIDAADGRILYTLK